MADGYDDDTFVNYEEDTVDPGYTLLVATTLFCIVSQMLLPCFVALGRRGEKRRLLRKQQQQEEAQQRQQQERAPEDGDTESNNQEEEKREEEPQPENDSDGGERTIQPGGMRRGKRGKCEGQDSSCGEYDDGISPSFYPKAYSSPKIDSNAVPSPSSLDGDSNHSENQNNNPPTTLKDWLLQPFDVGGWWGRPETLAEIGCKVPKPEPPIRQNTTSDIHSKLSDRRSSLSIQSANTSTQSVISNATTSILDRGWGVTGRKAVTGTGRRVKGRGVAERRRLLEQQRRESIARTNKNRNNKNTTSSTNNDDGAKKRHQQQPEVVAGDSIALDSEDVMLSKVDDQDICPDDAPDADEQAVDDVLKAKELLLQEYCDISCCGEDAWWKPATITRAFDDLLVIAEWEHESKQIIRLTIPYSIVAVMEGLLEIVTIALIAHYIGTDAVAAYTVVQLIVGLSSEFVGGVCDAVGVLCPHAIGARNPKLAGQYVQLSAVLFTVCMIPFFFVWGFATDVVFGWFGFDEEVANLGQQYAYILLFNDWIDGVSECYGNLLDVIGCEKFASLVDIGEGLLGVVIIVITLTLKEGTTLNDVAIIQLSLGVAFMCGVFAFTIHKGWVSKYLEGMMGSWALRNRKAAMNVIKTALPLALGSLIEYGEWELLTVFAGALGPAEVTAWGIVGSLWETIEATTIGMADAGEVRCAYHLGAGRPARARKSAYKSIYIGFFLAMIVTSVVFILGEDIAKWLTPDPTLQRMIVELLPLVGVGNITLTVGSLTWALVGAQGRYRLATTIGFVTSWGVTLPLASLFTYAFNINLQGLVASVVIGYSITGTTLTYVLLRSDWERHSKNIVALNATEGTDAAGAANDVDSSSSSSSSSTSED